MALTLPLLNLSGSAAGPWPALRVAPRPRERANASSLLQALPTESLARWTIEHEAGEEGEDGFVTRTVHVLRVHPRLMCLLCYCEDRHCIRSFSWNGLRQIREVGSGRAVDLATWIAAYVANQGTGRSHPGTEAGLH
ncbi:MAG TPA: hypothetical protein PLW24_11575 [Burkholderiaceae bacterium]|nr:hypothetical protein [Burkholderiaceae bacterium]HNB45683.1 hypothetical protein [Burkholderiaceae bacterium]HNG80103.1 hypothetical protein [Burkholderiaceae bacterium]